MLDTLVGRAPKALTWLLRVLALLAAIWALSRLLMIVPERIGYAGEIEWMEGGVLEHVRRVKDGLPIYLPPSPEFTPFLYTPFYYWLCAGLGSVFGLDVHLLRAVSFASFLGSCVVMAYFVGRRSRHFYIGVLGAGVFAATFRLGGAWFDIARADSLLVFLLLLGGLLLLEFRSRGTAIFAGCVFALAFLTKQSAILPATTVIVWSLLLRTKRSLAFAATTTGLILGAVALLHLTTDGWFTYYIFQLPSRHELLEDWKLLYWKNDVLGAMALPALLTVIFLVREVEVAENKLEGFGFTFFAAGIVGMTWSSRFHIGMYDNVLMPLHALGALTTALILARATNSKNHSVALEWATLLAVAGFIWRLEFPLESQVPSEGHKKQYARLVEKLKTLPQGTWVAYHGVPAVDAGLSARGHWMGMIDVIRGGGAEAEALTKRSEEWLRQHKAPVIVWSIDDPSTAWFTGPMRRYYRRSGRVSGPPPLTGWGQSPREIWVPRTEPHAAPDAHHRPPVPKR